MDLCDKGRLSTLDKGCSGLDLGSSSVGGEKWQDAGYFLKVELTRFANELIGV